MFILRYSAVWILSVGVVIALATYEWWGRWGYMIYCVSCAAPYVWYPLAFPLKGDVGSPRSDWYILKANLWIAVFSFIGNYWYTHYFYGVLKADYTFDAHRLNDVPIALYFMTHAYFMFYHVLTNCALRRVRSAFRADSRRFVFECVLVGAMAYTTAFMESLTICGFPYYRFEDRDMAYVLGSAFYGIYFLVSFPMFLKVDEAGGKRGAMTHATVFWESMVGNGGDVPAGFQRLWLGMDVMGGRTLTGRVYVERNEPQIPHPVSFLHHRARAPIDFPGASVPRRPFFASSPTCPWTLAGAAPTRRAARGAPPTLARSGCSSPAPAPSPPLPSPSPASPVRCT